MGNFVSLLNGIAPCHGYARPGGIRTTQTLNRSPRQSPAKRIWWGEEEQGSDMTDAHAWASGIERTLRRRRGLCPRGKKESPTWFCPPAEIAQERRRASPVKEDRGKGDYERPLRAGAYRSRPPAAFKVNCPKGARECGLGHCLLCRRGQSRPPRRAELSK